MCTCSKKRKRKKSKEIEKVTEEVNNKSQVSKSSSKFLSRCNRKKEKVKREEKESKLVTENVAKSASC